MTSASWVLSTALPIWSLKYGKCQLPTLGSTTPSSAMKRLALIVVIAHSCLHVAGTVPASQRNYERQAYRSTGRRCVTSHTDTDARVGLRLSAYGCGAEVGLDVRERAAAVPRREGAHEPRRAVELDLTIATRLRPRELAGVPSHEGLGVGGDVEVFVEPGIRLADLRLAAFDQQPVPLVRPAAGEIQPHDHAPIRESVAPQ